MPLFVRGTRHVEVTQSGQQLLRVVDPWLARLDASVRQIREQHSRRRVSITTFASFASLWLLPRIEAFQSRHPDIDIRVSALDAIADLDDPELDLALRYISPDQAPPGAVRLFGEILTPVVSRQLMEQIRRGEAPPLATPADLAQHTLAEEDDNKSSTEFLSWRHWLAQQGQPALQPRRWLYLNFTYQQVQAALAGHGVALARVAAGVRGAGARRTGRAVRPRRPHRQPVRLLAARAAAEPHPARGAASSPTGSSHRPRSRAARSASKRSMPGPARPTDAQSAMTPRSVTTIASGRSCGSGTNCASGDLGQRPRDADGRRVRVRGEPAVEEATAVAEPKARSCEAHTGHEHDVGHQRRAVAGGNSALVDERRRLAIPAPVVHLAAAGAA